MAIMFGRATVDDFATFRKAFDEGEGIRQSAGSTGNTVYQSVDEPNEIIVRVEFPTADAAKAFSTSQGLRDAMQRAGLKEAPRLLIVEEA